MKYSEQRLREDVATLEDMVREYNAKQKPVPRHVVRQLIMKRARLRDRRN